MAKRINVLARYRLERVVSELKEIRNESKLNKIDDWNLSKVTESIEQILHPPEKLTKGDLKEDTDQTTT